jgi:HK97 family phage major capsid protein
LGTFYRIWADNAFVRLPVYTHVGITVQPVTASVVGEGHATPVSPLQLHNIRLTPIKTAAMLVVTDELLQNVSGSGQQALNRAVLGAISDAVDSAFLGLITSIGTTVITSSGSTAANAKTDLKSALQAVNTVGPAKLYWIAGKDVAKRASTLATTTGADAFTAMSPTGGEMAGLPVMVASGIPSNSLMLVDASGIAADAGSPTVDTSSEADVMMNSAPTMDSSTPTPAQKTSMFMTNSTVIKAQAWIAAEVLRTDAVAVIEGINWGS